MKISKANAAQARRIFALCKDGDKVNGENLRKAVAKISASKPRGYLEILAALKRLVRLEIESQQVTVVSAQELDAATTDRIKADLISKYGSDLSFEFKVDPSLIAGLKIRVGNDVWDGSVKSRLARLAESF